MGTLSVHYRISTSQFLPASEVNTMAMTTTCVSGPSTLVARTPRNARQHRTAGQQAARSVRPMKVYATSSVPEPTPEAKAVTFGDMMNFSGIAPELVNGRSAMVAFVAAAGAELA